MGEIKSLEVPLECPICRSAPQIENRPATAISWVGVSIVHCCDLSIGADDEIAAISHWNTLCLGYRRALAAIPAADALDERDALRAKLARIASAWPIVRDADCSGGTLASAIDEIEAAISDGAADEATEASAALAEFHAKGGKTLDEIARAIPAAIADGGKDA